MRVVPRGPVEALGCDRIGIGGARMRGGGWTAAVALLVAGLVSGCSATPAAEQRSPAEAMRELVAPLSRLSSYGIVLTVRDGSGRVRMDGVQRLDDGRVVEAELSYEESDGAYELRVLDGTFYFGDGQDDGWVSVEADDPNLDALGISPDDLDVAGSLEALAGGVVAVRERPGRIVVDGARTRIVMVDVDPSQVPDLSEVLGFGLPGEVRRLEYRLLVDEDGLVRRFTVSVPLGGTSFIEVEATIIDPGTEVDVQAPADHVAVTAEELLGDPV